MVGGCSILVILNVKTCFIIAQKGISEKVVPQLEKVVGAKLEANLGRQLQTQFQTTGKQALQVFQQP